MLSKSFFRLNLIIVLAISGITTSAQAQCTFTYEQGLNVGCKLARTANDNGCYRLNCATATLATFERFINTCTEYALGVIAGFNQCNTPPPPINGRPNPVGGGSTNYDGIDGCYVINGQLICN